MRSYNSEQIQRSIRDYYEHIHGSNMNDVEIMDRFLEKFNLSRVKQEQIEIMNNPVTSTKIETMIKNLPKYKSSRPDSFA